MGWRGPYIPSMKRCAVHLDDGQRVYIRPNNIRPLEALGTPPAFDIDSMMREVFATDGLGDMGMFSELFGGLGGQDK